jgi:hypothetical protein
MARTATDRSINFDTASRIADFLGAGYSTKGVALASLKDLLPIYAYPPLSWLAHLQRNSSSRDQRAGDTAPIHDEPALVVVMFKKLSPNLPPGLTNESLAEFFTQLFTFETQDARSAFQQETSDLISNPFYHVLAVTAPTFNANDPDQLTHVIIAATLYQYDNKHGSYVALMGVLENGDPSVCILSDDYFVDPSSSRIPSIPTSRYFCYLHLFTALS